MPPPAVTRYSELQIVTIGVRDLARARAFYEGLFGYACIAEAAVPESCRSAWGIPEGSRARIATLARMSAGEPVRRGMLRLLECTPGGEHAWGGYERYFDYGHYALNIRVPDIRAKWPDILAAGAKPKSGPTHWVVEPGMEAWDSLSWDPDGTLVDVYQMIGRESVFKPIEGLASEIETVAIHSSDADRMRAFYTGLGYTVFFDRRITDLSAFFHLPSHVALRDVNLMKPELSTVGRIEIVQYEGLPGERVGRKARPPNLGILWISFEASDIDSAQREVAALGATDIGTITASDVPGVGAARLFMADGPDGERLEFLQRTANT
jgi:catechol 2,3-dioxygenase-like lactoylglutathione lyase family enzyme